MRARGLLVLLLLALPAASAAEGLGVTPAELQVTGAQRGETYVREVMLQNQFDSASTFTLDREGETGAWAALAAGGSELVVPPRTDERVRILLHVPDDAPNGAHEGALRFVAAAKSRPDGSGFALRYAVAVPLHVEVGGPQDVRLRFVAARAADVEVGSAPVVLVDVVNEGNVQAEARASVRVLDAQGQEAASAANATRVRPGERATLQVPIGAPLPQGTYAVEVAPVGAPALAQTSFKVVPVGTLGKEGSLRYLRHEPVVLGGLPVRVVGVFENTGAAPISRARLVGEAWAGEQLVSAFASDELAVPTGETVDLVAYFTSPVDGELRLVAHVVYDGFRSPANEGILVSGAPRDDAGKPWLLAGALALVALGALVALLRVRRRG